MSQSDEWGELSLAGADKLRELIDTLASDPTAPSSVRNPEQARLVHVADSLAGLGVDALKEAASIADVGSGAGFPGLALAAALPSTHVDLIEANGRKCEFMRRAAEHAGIANARIVNERAETWAAAKPPDGGREAYDAVTARAVGRLSTLAELASPLLREDGVLVAWKGRRDPGEEAEAQGAAERLAMEPVETRWVGPYAGSENRHLHVFRKSAATPNGLPRRPGMAKKRPFGAG